MRYLLMTLLLASPFELSAKTPDKLLGNIRGNKIVARYFEELPEGYEGPWVVEVVEEGSSPEEFYVRGINVIEGLEGKGLLSVGSDYVGTGQPKNFPFQHLLTKYRQCRKPDGAIFYILKPNLCTGDEILGKRENNLIVAKYFEGFPKGKEGPWIAEIIEGTNPEEFLIRGSNIIPGLDKKMYLNGETGYAGTQQPAGFPETALMKTSNQCLKPDGAVFYVPKPATCMKDGKPSAASPSTSSASSTSSLDKSGQENGDVFSNMLTGAGDATAVSPGGLAIATPSENTSHDILPVSPSEDEKQPVTSTSGSQSQPGAVSKDGFVGKFSYTVGNEYNVIHWDQFPKVEIPKRNGKYIFNHVDIGNHIRGDLKESELQKYFDIGNSQVGFQELRDDYDRKGTAGTLKVSWSPENTFAWFTVDQWRIDGLKFADGKFGQDFYTSGPNDTKGKPTIQKSIDATAGMCWMMGHCKAGEEMKLSTEWAWFDFEIGGSTDQDEVNTYIFTQHQFNKTMKPGSLFYLHYQAAALATYGNIKLEHYQGGASHYWNTTAKPTATSEAMNFPKELYGKSLGDLSPVASMEVYPFYEDFLPDGLQVKNMKGEPYFIWGNNVTIHHYRDEDRHWAASLCGFAEAAQRLLKDGQQVAYNIGLYYLGGSGFSLNPEQWPELGLTQEKFPEYMFNEKGRRKQPFFLAIPKFAAEVYGVAPFFLGVKYVSNWQALGKLKAPVPEDGTATDAIDMRVLTHYHASMARIFSQYVSIDGANYSIADLVDGNEKYLRQETEVSYEGFKNGEFVKLNAAERKINRLPFVYQIVNEKKKLSAILAFKPYGDQDLTGKVSVRYGSYKRAIEIPNNEVVLILDKLK